MKHLKAKISPIDSELDYQYTIRSILRFNSKDWEIQEELNSQFWVWGERKIPIHSISRKSIILVILPLAKIHHMYLNPSVIHIGLSRKFCYHQLEVVW